VTDREACVVGIDFGTMSGRVVVARVADGAELGWAVHDYPHGVMEDRFDPTGQRLPPAWALQVPEDYREVLRTAVPAALAAAGVEVDAVVGIGIDFTACTMIPVLDDGTPLCEVDRFADRPHAYVKLWKHHAAQPQADRINRLASSRAEPWLPRYGGLVSSEGEFAKGLELFEGDREVYDATALWVEASDWLVWQLCGRLVHNACAAGFKGIYQDGRFPSPDFLDALAPGFSSFVPDKLRPTVVPFAPLGAVAGRLTAEAAAWTGLLAGIAVAVGNVDAHVTAPAAQAVEPGQLTLIMGTSTCHIISSEERHEVPGICGVVDGGVVTGRWGYEAGQSGSGDILGWFTRTGVPASYHQEAWARGESVHELLTRLAGDQAVGEHGLVALDWHGGNRSVLADHELSGAVVGMTVTTKPEEVYRALMEATAFGTRVIVETYRAHGVPVGECVVAGGLAKNSLLMQIYADVTRLALSVLDSEQGPALGAAIHAAVAADAYPDVPTAARAMGRVRRDVYRPDEARALAYDGLFALYLELHDHFGRHPRLMRSLAAIRREARSGAGGDRA
jgi:L-ribulokinase